MGADFLFCAVPHCKLDDARKKCLKEIIESCPSDQRTLDTDDPESREEWQESMKQALVYYIGAPMSREVSSWHPRGCPYEMLFTGGMSWGDLPTEMAEHFIKIGNCEPVYAQLEEWAAEDSGTCLDKQGS